MKARLFLDLSNFASQARKQMPGVRLDYLRMGDATAAQAQTFSQDFSQLECMETRIHGSILPPYPEWDSHAIGWADWLVKLQTAGKGRISLFLTPRAHTSEQSTCPSCRTTWIHTHQKEELVDMQMAMDIVSCLEKERLDAVILATQDRDFLPVVFWLQRRGIKVINLGWAHGGHALAEACDALVTVQELGESAIYSRRRAS